MGEMSFEGTTTMFSVDLTFDATNIPNKECYRYSGQPGPAVSLQS